MRFRVLAASATLLAFVTGTANAASVTFDFDTFANGDRVGSVSMGGLSATVTATGGIGEAYAFDTGFRQAADPDLFFPDEDFQRALIIQENGNGIPDDNARGGTITFDFDTDIFFDGVDLLDIEEPGVHILLDGFDLFDARVGMSGNNSFASVDGVSGIFGRELTFQFRGSGALDNLSVSAVPLPPAALLFGAGLMGAAAIRRRQQK